MTDYKWHPEERYWSIPQIESILEKLASLFEGETIYIDKSLYLDDSRKIFLDSRNNKLNEIFYLGIYYPYWLNKEYEIRNPNHDMHSKNIMKIKKGKDSAIDYFYKILEPMLPIDWAVAIIPSHNPADISSGIRTLAKKLAANNRFDATACLLRHIKISKLSQGGDRNINQHLQTIRVNDKGIIRNKEVLLLDDVASTGNSLLACKHLLTESGAKVVKCVVLGLTGGV